MMSTKEELKTKTEENDFEEKKVSPKRVFSFRIKLKNVLKIYDVNG